MELLIVLLIVMVALAVLPIVFAKKRETRDSSNTLLGLLYSHRIAVILAALLYLIAMAFPSIFEVFNGIFISYRNRVTTATDTSAFVLILVAAFNIVIDAAVTFIRDRKSVYLLTALFWISTVMLFVYTVDAWFF